MSRYIETAPIIQGKPRFFCDCDVCHKVVPVKSATPQEAITTAQRLKWEVKEVTILGKGKTTVCICPRCQKL